MARPSDGPWWWEARGGYYATIDGRRINLHTTDPSEARNQWHILHAQANIETTQGRTVFAVLADRYLEHTKAKRRPKTYSNYRYFLQTFLNYLAAREMTGLTVAEMKPYHLDQCVTWQQERANSGMRDGRNRRLKPWDQSAIGSFMRCVQSCLNWGFEKGLLPSNPLSGRLDIPAVVSRGAEADMPDELYARILECAGPNFRDFFIAVRHSGTRPGMVAALRPEHFHEEARCWIFREHKTDGTTGEPMVVHLSDFLFNLTKKKISQGGGGFLFVNDRGNQWVDSTWGKAMQRTRDRYRRKYGTETKAVTYWLRHTFATSHLAAGVPDAIVAAMINHKGTAMIDKHYGHVGARARLVKSHLSMTPTPEELRAVGVDVSGR